MKFLDFFISEDKKTKTVAPEKRTASPINLTGTAPQTASDLNGNVKVYVPRDFNDVAEIISVLSLGKPAIVNMKELNDATAQRVLDLLSGAIYALHGGLYPIDKSIYVFTPVD